MNSFENQQKRISFLALHRDLTGMLKPTVDIDGKRHEELCQYVFTLVENLFAKYPVSQETKAPITKANGEDLPL